MIKQDAHSIKGIQRDLTVSKFNSEYAFDARNIRLTARENSTLLSITNEKGNKEIPVTDSEGNAVSLNGTVIGHNVLNSYLTLFTTDNTTDNIYRLERTGDSFECVTLFTGSIGLNTDNPIECIGVYESETIQKVYWVDGLNSPRVINIMNTYEESESNKFDFVSKLQLNEEITITRNDVSNGSFPSGVVQYAFSYYNKYSQESAIFYTSPINYISFSSRGGSAEETVSCSFTITVTGADTNFDYIRIYSIIRSSIDGTPDVKQIVDLPVQDTITYTDTNTTGESLDSTALLYIGGENIIAGTMTSKDNTLFLGNIKLNTSTVPEELRTNIKELSPYFTGESLTGLTVSNSGYYTYKHLLGENSSVITSFKYGETYRFGIQFQDETGRWSEVVYIDDVENTTAPDLGYLSFSGGLTSDVMIQRVIGRVYLTNRVITQAVEAGYVRARGVVVYPSIQDRSVIAQGIVCPTVFRLGDRVTNAPYAQSSWFSRPNYYYDRAGIQQQNSDGNYGFLLFWFYSDSDTGYEQSQYTALFDFALNSGYTMEIRQGPRTITLTPVSRTDDYCVFTVPDPIDYQSIPLVGAIWISNLGLINYTYTVEVQTDTGTYQVTYTLTSLYFYYKGYEYCNRPLDWTIGTGVPSVESPAGIWSTFNTNVTYNNSTYNLTESEYGNIVEFRHNHPIPDNWRPGAEIQSIVDPMMYPVTNTVGTDMEDTVRNHENDFYIDQNVVTFHSPEIEWDTNVQNISGQQLQFRIVGYAMVDATKGAEEINASGTYGEDQIGAYNISVGAQVKSMNAGKNRATAPYWIDTVYNRANEDTVADSSWAWVTYLWHRNGSLNNDTSRDDRSATLTSKKISNLKFCGSTEYFAYNSRWNAYVDDDDNHTGITPVQIFNSDDVTLTMIDAPENSNLPDISYYGNIDSVISMTATGHYWPILNYFGQQGDTYLPGTSYESTYSDVIYNGATMVEDTDGYPICLSQRYSSDDDSISSSEAYSLIGAPTRTVYSVRIRGDFDRHLSNTEFGKDPIEMKYNSTPHAVFALNYSTDGKQVCMPTNRCYVNNSLVNANDANFSGQITTIDSGVTSNYSLQYHFLWDVPVLGGDRQGTDNVYQDSIQIQSPSSTTDSKYSYYWIGELYRSTVDNRFGGTSEAAILANTWYPAGEPLKLDSTSTYQFLDYTIGDTFLGRYDCLKTYAATEATNNVTEIVSFMCESHVNMDGRYDRNRGLLDNNAVTPTNFNLFNEVYNQKNNYFTYSTLDYETYTNSYFPNTVVWSEEKLNSSTTDLWTKLYLTSSLDLDGDKGEITSLNVYNNEIYCFQRQGLSNILFNSRVQIPTSDSEPIEITNGLKVSGKRYISNTLGCNNKWSILEAPTGIYYIDNISNGIYVFNGSEITSLSDSLGFVNWISQNNSLESWNPVDFSNFVTYYDNTYSDVYFVNRDTSLVFSGLLNQFTSFMDYGSTEAMFNLDGKFYAIKNGSIWEQFAGDYNMFYGEFKPYSVTFISNPEEPYDKIFNNIEFRADCWTTDDDGNAVLANDVTFDTLEVWNEYQKGVATLTRLAAKPSPLKKKFRVWRANIPRANTDWNGVKANNRDRIRNTWAYVKLAMNKENTARMEFHDMIVSYFV